MDDNLMLIKQFQMQGGSKGADAAFAEEYRNYQQIQNVYMGAIREIRARLETLDMEFQYRHKHNPIHHIQSRVKTLPSIMKKLSDMGQPMTITSAKKHLHDIAGVRVVCCYVDDIYLIADLLLSQDDISLIFEKDSTRTRCSFETAAYDQGAHCTLLGAGSQIGKKESMADTAPPWAMPVKVENRTITNTSSREAPARISWGIPLSVP